MKYLFLCVMGFYGCFACSNLSAEKATKSSEVKHKKTKTKGTLYLQPFDGLPLSTTRNVQEQLSHLYSGPIILRPSIPLPQNAVNLEREGRFHADTLIRFLSRQVGSSDLIIGLTNQDITTAKIGNSSWGIMGLGFCPGNACIASTFRLKGTNRLEKLYKVAIHELGHTQGLQHCPVNSCLMRDAEGKDHLNEEKGFCPSCKNYLTKAGWNLK
jgi:archaemetzincin